LEPGFFIPILAGGIAAGPGYFLGRSGRFGFGLVLSLAFGAASYVLMFHSQILGWEGMGPGIVAILGLVPASFGVATGTYLGRWRAGMVENRQKASVEAPEPRDRNKE
jgi:hypothetical protein